MASLSDTFLMLPRELPRYLKVAYSVRYANEPNTGNCLTRICHIVQRVFSLIKELITSRTSAAEWQVNADKLKKEFEAIHQSISGDQKPLCIYFVSDHDCNGAILGTPVYYYHHYKIRDLQKHFSVAPKLVASQDEMKKFMTSVKQQYADREIKFVDIVAHGNQSCLAIQSVTSEKLQSDLFSDCAPDATILLDACQTGMGDKNIADDMARNTPGRTVLAPAPSLFFSKPVIRVTDHRVISAVHGFAIINAYECKSFSYPGDKAIFSGLLKRSVC